MLKLFPLSLLVLVLDQFTKYLALEYLTLYEEKPITLFFNLSLAHNKGAAFSFLSQAGQYGVWFLIGFSLVMSLFIFVWLLRVAKNKGALGVSLALILGGALGNLLDRIRYGYVIDFIDIYIKNWHWPAFNIADSAICIGMVLLLLREVNAKQ